MGANLIDPTGELPEADLIEQQSSPKDTRQDGEPQQEARPLAPAITTSLADEADLLEQATPVPDDVDDDDYPHDPADPSGAKDRER